MMSDGLPVCQESGFDLFVRLRAPWLFLKTAHCAQVNAVLGGGIVKGEITELVGNIAVGKTQLCLSLIADLLAQDEADSHVVYLDTNGSFRGHRLLQMLLESGISRDRGAQLLSRVFVLRVYDGNDLKTALAATERRKEQISLIVIDSIGAALAETTLNYNEGGKELQKAVTARLRLTIETLGCAVVTTNHFVYWNKYPAPSLGQHWISAVDSRFLLAKLPDCWYIQLIHSKRFQLTGERALYRITERGVDSFVDADLHEEETQAVDEIISQNWGTVMEIYSQSIQ